MSRMLLSKLDVDVMVQLMVLGPLGAAEWGPLVEDADGFGTRLWSVNYAIAARSDDLPRPAYVFAPLPVGVTAVEGLKQCDYFLYQSADPGGRWERGGLGKLLSELKGRLIALLDGYDGAPSGWDVSGLAARADRAAPQSVQSETKEPPTVTALRATWDRAGMPLESLHVYAGGSLGSRGDLGVLAEGGYRPARRMGFAPVSVTLCADHAAAELVFIARVSKLQPFVGHHDAHVYRFGELVVTTQLLPQDTTPAELIDHGIARLGTPDAHWWTGSPPLAEVAGKVIATRVPLTKDAAGARQDKQAIFARTPEEVTALLGMIDDPALRARLQEVSTHKRTILLLRGVFDVDEILSAKLYEEAGEPAISDDVEHRLVLQAKNATMGVGSVVLLDRLPRSPHTLELEATHLQTAMIGSEP